jgi:multidrug efflux system membrane fusion protein
MKLSTQWPLLNRTRAVMLMAGLIVLAALIWLMAPGRARIQAASRHGPAAIPVDAVAASRADVPIYLDGLGTVQAFFTVRVTARVDGELQKVAFVEGQTMKKGDLLAQIDPRPYQAALDQARATEAKDAAQLANAKQDLQRYEVLEPNDLASKQTVDTQRALVAQLEAQVKSDSAAIENARTQLSYTTITSPIDGRTGIRLVDPGNIVRATDTTGIVVMTQLQPIAVIFTLPEDALPTLADALGGGTVSIAALTREGRNELDRGTVSLIDNQIDQTTGTIRVKATFPNLKQRLWPGEFVTARVLVSTQKNVLTIPAAALQRGPDGVFAYVVRADSTVEPRTLKISNESTDLVIVEGGLAPGERVVTSNQYRLQPGARVRINAAVASGSGDASGHEAS